MKTSQIGRLVLTLCASSLPISAATVGPDNFGYTAIDVAYAYTDISGTGTAILPNVDDDFAPVALGFTFDFYGNSYTTAYAGANGILTFGSGTSAYDNQDFSALNLTLDAIAPLWDDWVTNRDSVDAVYFRTDGVAGSRQTIIQWHQVEGYSTSPSEVSFQVVLSEGSNDIRFNYADSLSGDTRNNGASATVGITQAGGATSGNNLLYSFNSASIGVAQPNGQASILISAVPEPSSLALLALGGTVLLARRRRRS